MNAKKTLISVLCIGLIAMTAGAGTFAHFSDTETSTGNTFTAGTLDLKVSDGDEPDFDDGVTATWTCSDMKPGDTVGPYFVWLQNFGTIEADHVEIKCSNSVTDPTVPEGGPESDTEEGTTDMDKAMEIRYLGYNGTNFLNTLTDLNGNNIVDLDDFENWNGGEGFGDVTLPPAANPPTQKTFTMELRFHPTLADNDYQGDTLTTTITFTLNQHASQ